MAFPWSSDFPRSAARSPAWRRYASHIISAMPEIKFPVKGIWVFSEPVSCAAGVGGLQIVDHDGDVEGRMRLERIHRVICLFIS